MTMRCNDGCCGDCPRCGVDDGGPVRCACGWRGSAKQAREGCPECGCDCDIEEDYDERGDIERDFRKDNK